ncbi:tRNA-nucleotidyltransferase 1 [Asticcacaulis biprosthecium C19]|uniref:tRNA-nucleotidyltransferase 1 n=1 Tax=Asticcacaulis biprosthecium C19 TaxID=715226 RepID=F4QPQ3_9CAUL|nr:CCA tRNA nucleotidyltransferase [Asticcacaulis biprosthecium]EGF90190.1 tRNA-nucleotidyltransferase 1 [Asticcacaulis biprosthecium C19]
MTRIVLTDAMKASGTRAVFAALEARGGKGCVRFVGGCVRNVLLGVPGSDLDLSTQLTPDETEAALSAAGMRHVPTGKDYGTITAVVDGEPYEITSLREDVETDGRRAVVSYTTVWAKDAQRRDFYVNALYADIEGLVYDPTGHGLADIAERRVRFIGEAQMRIREDYLRILRFFRFTAGYALSVDPDSLQACIALQAGIDGLSGERLFGETMKTLSLANPLLAFEAMQSGGILSRIVPGWILVGEGLPELRAMITHSDDAERRLMALVDSGLGLGVNEIKSAQARLKFSQAIGERMIAAGDVVTRLEAAEAGDIARLIYRHGRQAVEDAVLLAAVHGDGQPHELLRLMADIDVPKFPLKGSDLIARGMTAGPEVGQRLKQIEAEWLAADFAQSVIDAALVG